MLDSVVHYNVCFIYDSEGVAEYRTAVRNAGIFCMLYCKKSSKKSL